MLLHEVAQTSAAVAATRSRNAKRDLLAELLSRTPVEELPIVARYLAGELRQRRTGVSWGSLRSLPEPAEQASLQVAEVDARFQDLAGLAGPGSRAVRARLVAELFGRATEEEQRLLWGLVSGEVRQGALDAALLDAAAAASQVPVAALRRAAMLSGSSAVATWVALADGRQAVEAIDLQVGRAVRPMLASSAPDLTTAVDKFASAVIVDSKLDGFRIQVHRTADQVKVYSRSLDDITERLPGLVELVGRFPAASFVLDGELLASDAQGRPRPFQETASRASSGEVELGVEQSLAPAFFDLLAVDDESLIDLPLTDRLARLAELVPPKYLTARVETDDVDSAQEFFDQVLAAGHEGVVVKDPRSPYQAGRRGSGWVKVKPRHTLDLVVLGVERGSGRRRGWLSNIHLGARDAETGEFVMLGKTFKGMTDQMLAWQTERFTELATGPVDAADWVVELRPEQVVEIAFDGVQRSTRYPGGVALRFARVLRYRDDKSAAEADTIQAVRSLLR